MNLYETAGFLMNFFFKRVFSNLIDCEVYGCFPDWDLNPNSAGTLLLLFFHGGKYLFTVWFLTLN